eukprot:1185778-Prorocentrum_minimum.AAC.6
MSVTLRTREHVVEGEHAAPPVAEEVEALLGGVPQPEGVLSDHLQLAHEEVQRVPRGGGG